MTTRDSAPIIETKDLTIRFGGHVAVDHVDFQMAPFTLKSIIGPNGAGKTTFFNMLTGQYRPTEGQVLLRGRDITTFSTAERTRLGMGRSFQLTNIFPMLTVLENVRIAVQSREGFGLNFWRSYLHYGEAEDEAYGILEDVLLNEKYNATSAALTHGEKRKLEIAILLALKSDILFLDEPTAGMSLEEVPAILDPAAQNQGDTHGCTLLLVEHKMDMILSLSDTIMVLQEGKLIADGEPDEIYRSKAVQEAYLGGGTQRE